MTVSAHASPPLPFAAISPSQSLEDIHFNLAQEITRAMGSPISTAPAAPPNPTSSPSPSPDVKPLLTPPAATVSRSSRSHYSRAPIVKPSPAEEELVRKIHRKVGGPSKLSTYDDPAKVRHVVIEALALEQLHLNDADRIRRGQLSVFERRVVRTVTNRGAAVRSRMRQRKQVAQLKHELRLRDLRCRQLENVIKGLCSKYALPMPYAMSPSLQHHTHTHVQQQQQQRFGGAAESETESMHSTEHTAQRTDGTSNVIVPSHALQAHVEAQHQSGVGNFGVESDLFGNLMEQMIPHTTWV